MPTEASCRHFPLLPFPIYFKTRIPLFQSHLPFLDISVITHTFSLIINLIITVSFSWLLRYSPSHLHIIFLKACHLHFSCIKYYWISLISQPKFAKCRSCPPALLHQYLLRSPPRQSETLSSSHQRTVPRPKVFYASSPSLNSWNTIDHMSFLEKSFLLWLHSITYYI